MTSTFDRLQRWSWHQSHDQATVLLLVPADLSDDELSIHLDERHLIVSVRRETAAIKGCLYGPINTKTSSWQLERSFASHKGRKPRTASTSAGSSDSSSYAILTDPDISSSFANSLAAQTDHETDFELTDTDYEPAHPSTHQSPTFSSPSDSHDEESSEAEIRVRRREKFAPPSAVSSSRAASPPGQSLASSVSSSLHLFRRGRGLSRLLTIHLDKTRPEIWPVLIVTGVTEDVELESYASASELSFSSTSTATLSASLAEQKYNMDPTSLVGAGLVALHDSVEGAFEYFCRAWLLDHNPVAAMKLASVYMPLQTTPQRSTIIPSERGYPDYLRRIGGNTQLAKVYLEVGLLYLEGLGSSLATSTSSLSQSPFSLGLSEVGPGVHGADPDTAQRYFRRARVLDPTLEVPEMQSAAAVNLVMPALDVQRSTSTVKDEDYASEASRVSKMARKTRRSDDHWSSLEEKEEWTYLYLPGLLGAGLAIGIVGVMSVSWWRNNSR